MIGISFSLFIVVLICIHNVSIQSCSCVFVNTVLFDIKIRIHVFRQIRCRPQSGILRALWTSVLTRIVKTMLFETIHEMVKIAVRIEMNDFIIRAR